MKKLYLLCAAALGLAFTACDNYDEPNAPAQKNEPITVVSASGITVSSAVEQSQVLDLKAISDSKEPVKLASIELTDFPESSELIANLELAKTDAFENPVACPLEIVDGALVAYGEDIQEAYVKLMGKNPATKQVQGRFILYTYSGTQKIQLGEAPNFAYCSIPLTIKPYAAAHVLESAYYFVPNKDLSAAVKMNHAADVDVYDDPVFSIKVDVVAGTNWVIVPESTLKAGDLSKGFYGVDGDATAFEGTLKANAAEGNIEADAALLVTVNVEELTYKLSYAFEYLYTPGVANGNKPVNSQLLYTYDYATYQGFAAVKTSVFFCSAEKITEGVRYCDGGSEGVLKEVTGKGNPTPIKIDKEKPGLYWINANISNLTYSMTHCESWGIVGTLTEWADGKDIALTPSADYLTWTGDVVLGDGAEFKFRANGTWDINVGGEIGDLTFNSPDNIKVGTANGEVAPGSYTVTLDFSQLPYQATLTPKK